MTWTVSQMAEGDPHGLKCNLDHTEHRDTLGGLPQSGFLVRDSLRGAMRSFFWHGGTIFYCERFRPRIWLPDGTVQRRYCPVWSTEPLAMGFLIDG